MRNWTIYALTVLLFISCSSDKKEAILHHSKAKELFKKDDIKNASNEIGVAIKLDSSNLDFQITKAKILLGTDNYEESIRILKRLLVKKFKVDTVNFTLGSTYFSYGNFMTKQPNNSKKADEFYNKALNYYNTALSINNQYFKAYEEKQDILHNLELYEESMIFLNTAIILFPDSMSLISSRGIEKLYLGDLIGAMKDLDESIKSNKLDSANFSNAYRFRGNLYVERGNIDQAILDLTNAIKYDKKNEYAVLTRGGCYKQKGLKDKACEDFRKAADLGFVGMYPTIKEYCND